MSLEHVNHSHLKQFVEDTVNLKQDSANKYREQARGLRKKLDSYLANHPDFELKKMLLSGSLAKSTALSSLNDIDIAAYISGVDTSYDANELLSYLKERLESAYPNIDPSQITIQNYSIQISFKGTGLDVDVVPIIYDDDPDWKGHLVSQYDGSYLMTSIPMHLDFFKQRKQKHPHFAEIVRLVKWWVNNEKSKDDSFRFKSFMVELILCRLWDDGEFDGTDYIKALEAFFDYLVNSQLNEAIIFDDYYGIDEVSPEGVMQIYDPVNPDNNAAANYSQSNKDAILAAANAASDNISAAIYSTTKKETIDYWKRLFGPSFGSNI